MTNIEWMEMIRKFPEKEHNRLVLALQNGTELSVDTIFRFETHYMVIRGRVAGTVEESRAFIVPYDQMLYLRWEKIVKMDELEEVFGKPGEAPVTTGQTAAAASPAVSTAPAAAPTDPAAASRLLLDKLRANRSISLSKVQAPVSVFE